MQALVIDDETVRHLPLRQCFPDHEFTFTTTVAEGIGALRTSAFDLVFLDHDIYGMRDAKWVPVDTFMPVAEFIAQQVFAVPPAIILHSRNPDGAERLRRVLAPTGLSVTVKMLDYILREQGCPLPRNQLMAP